MKAEDAIRAAEWVLLPLLLIVGSFYAGRYVGRVQAVGTMVAKTDTVVRIVTQYKDFPQPAQTALAGFIPVPRYIFLADTVTVVEPTQPAVQDTTPVYLPRQQNYYEEEAGKLRLWVSGYQPCLDRYEVDWPTTIITETHRQRQKHWGFGISGGYGIMPHDGKVLAGPTLNISVSYNFLTW